MPRIIDNIEVGLAEDLRAEIARGAVRLDAAIGYFNLRGWRELADAVDTMPSTESDLLRRESSSGWPATPTTNSAGN